VRIIVKTKKQIFKSGNPGFYFQRIEQLNADHKIKVDISGLGRFLEIIEAPTTLKNLLSYCPNILNISNYIFDACSATKWRWLKSSTSILPTIAVELLKEESTLLSDRPTLKVETLRSHNASFKLLAGSFPLYATIAYRQNEGSHSKKRFNHLQAQAFISCLSFNKSYSKTQTDGFQKLKKKGLNAVRALANLNKQDQLVVLPEKSITPEKYLLAIRCLPKSHIIHDFANLLEKSIELNNNHDRKPIFKIDDILNIEPLIPEHVISAPDDYREHHQATDPQQLNKLFYNEINFMPDAVPPGYDIFFPHVKKTSHKFNAGQAGKKIAKDNQLLSIAWAELTKQDIACLLKTISPTQIHPSKSDITTSAALHLMLWAGMDLQAITSTRLGHRQPFDGTTTYQPETGTIMLLTKGPLLTKDEKSYESPQTIAKQNHILLTLPAIAKDAINLAITQNDEKLLFTEPRAMLKDMCTEMIGKIPETYRLTLSRIQNYQFRVLSRMPNSDISTAALTLGKKEYLTRTKIHYASFDSATLEKSFKQSCSKILDNDYQQSKLDLEYPAEQSLNIGTPFRPKCEIIRSTAQNLITAIDAQRDKINNIEDLINFHNLFTAYTAFMVMFTTGHRRAKLPYITDNAWDIQTGFAVIRDKDTADYHHSRLIWLIEATQRQLINYQKHLLFFYDAIGSENISIITKSLTNKPKFFFISPKYKLNITLGFLHNILKQHGYDFPGHPQRHLLKSELQENGCDPEAIELFLGHWNHGQEGHVKTSSMHPEDYKNELMRFLPQLAKRLNIRQIEGLNSNDNISSTATLIPLSKTRKKQSKLATSFTVAPGQIWFESIGTARRNMPLGKAFREQQLYVLSLLKEQLPELFQPTEKTQLTNQQIDPIIKLLTPARLLPTTRYRRLNFINMGLTLGKEKYNWDITIPEVPKIFPKLTNRARPSTMRQLIKCRVIEQKLYEDLNNKLPTDPTLHLGQLLLCAIIHGGLLHQKWVKAFPIALNNAIFQHDDWLWLNLYSGKDIPDDEDEFFLHQSNQNNFRRWFADPLSQLLIYHLLEQFPADRILYPEISAWSAIKKYLNHLKIPTTIRPKSLRNLFFIASARSSVTIPAFLSEYAENKLPSASLPDQLWLRSLTGQIIPVSYGRRKNKTTKIQNRAYLEGQQREHYKKLHSFFSTKGGGTQERRLVKQKLSAFINDTEEHPTSIIMLLAKWTLRLLDKPESEKENRQNMALKVSTVKEYLGYIGKEVIAVCRDDDPLDFEIHEYISFYEKVGAKLQKNIEIEKEQNKNSRNYNREIGRLNLFHMFLHAYEKQPLLYPNDLLKKGGILPANVSTNLITTKQYEHILLKLGWGDSNLTRYQKIALIAVIIWYRTGSRKEEILGLLIQDFQNSDLPEILIYPNVWRKLKTESSIRGLPCKPLLPEAEIAYIKEWVDSRLAEPTASPKSPLFSESPVSNALIHNQKLLSRARELIKTELHDQSAVIHHERDSFIQNHILKMMTRDDIQLLSTPYFMQGDEFKKESRAGYCDYFFEGDKMGRRKLWVGSTLLGHADIDEGFRSYFHLTDWLLGYHLRHPNNLPQITVNTLPAEALIRLTGISRPQIYAAKKSAYNPILKCVQLRHHKYKTLLKHPMMSKSFPLPSNKTICSKPQGLPEFDVAITLALNSHSIILSQNKLLELELARKFYEKIQILSIAKQQKQKQIASTIINGYIAREQYIQITDRTDTIKIITFLQLLGFRPAALRVTFHASRYHSPAQQQRTFNVWASKIANLESGQECQIKGSKDCARIHLVDVSTRCIDSKQNSTIETSSSIRLTCNLVQQLQPPE